MAGKLIYEDINTLLKEKYLLHHIKQDFSEIEEGYLVFIYTRLLFVYDDVNKPEYATDSPYHFEPTSDILKHILRCLRSLGLSFLAAKSSDLLDKKKASRILSAVHDKVISKYDKNISQRVRMIIKREQLISKMVPKKSKNPKDESSQRAVEKTISDNEAVLGETPLPAEEFVTPLNPVERKIPGGWQLPRTPMKSTLSMRAEGFPPPPPAFINSPLAEVAEDHSLNGVSACILTPPSEFEDKSSSELSADSGCIETPEAPLANGSRRRTYVVNHISSSDASNDSTNHSPYVACTDKLQKSIEMANEQGTYCIPKVPDVLEERQGVVESDEESHQGTFNGEHNNISLSFEDHLRNTNTVGYTSGQDHDSEHYTYNMRSPLDMMDKRRTYRPSKVSDISGKQNGAKSDEREHSDNKNKRRTYVVNAVAKNNIDLKNVMVLDEPKVEENEPELEENEPELEENEPEVEENEPELENLKAYIENDIKNRTYDVATPRNSKDLNDLNTTGFDLGVPTKKPLYVDLLKSDVSFVECGKGHIPRGRELTRTPPLFNASSFNETTCETLGDSSIMNVPAATRVVDTTYDECIENLNKPVMNGAGEESSSLSESLTSHSYLSEFVNNTQVSDLTFDSALQSKFNFDNSLALFPIRGKKVSLVQSPLNSEIDHECKTEKSMEPETQICDDLEPVQHEAEARVVIGEICKTRKRTTKLATVDTDSMKALEGLKERVDTEQEEVKCSSHSRGRKRATEKDDNYFIEEDQMGPEALHASPQKDISQVIQEVEFKRPKCVRIRRIAEHKVVKGISLSGNTTTIEKEIQAVSSISTEQNSSTVRTRSKPRTLDNSNNDATDSASLKAHSTWRKNKKDALETELVAEKNRSVKRKPSRQRREEEDDKIAISTSEKELPSSSENISIEEETRALSDSVAQNVRTRSKSSSSDHLRNDATDFERGRTHSTRRKNKKDALETEFVAEKNETAKRKPSRQRRKEEEDRIGTFISESECAEETQVLSNGIAQNSSNVRTKAKRGSSKTLNKEMTDSASLKTHSVRRKNKKDALETKLIAEESGTVKRNSSEQLRDKLINEGDKIVSSTLKKECPSSAGKDISTEEDAQASRNYVAHNPSKTRTKTKPGSPKTLDNDTSHSALIRTHSVGRKNQKETELSVKKGTKMVKPKPSQHDHQQPEEMKNEEHQSLLSNSEKKSESETEKKSGNLRGRPRSSKVSGLIKKFNQIEKENTDDFKHTGPKKRINKTNLQKNEKFQDASSKNSMPLTENKMRPSRRCKEFARNAITEMLNETD